MRRLFLCSPLILLTAIPSPAQAIDVNLGATLVNSCVLALSTTGVMTPSADGTVIGSEQSGGNAAVLSVTALGGFPTISFTAPSLTTSPAGWTSTHTAEIRYTSTGGANQAYTAGTSSATVSLLRDTFTVHGRVTSTLGFAAGNYNLRSVATCSQ